MEMYQQVIEKLKDHQQNPSWTCDTKRSHLCIFWFSLVQVEALSNKPQSSPDTTLAYPRWDPTEKCELNFNAVWQILVLKYHRKFSLKYGMYLSIPLWVNKLSSNTKEYSRSTYKLNCWVFGFEKQKQWELEMFRKHTHNPSITYFKNGDIFLPNFSQFSQIRRSDHHAPLASTDWVLCDGVVNI